MRTLLASLLFAVPVFAAPVPKALKPSALDLAGTWEVVEWYSAGNPVERPAATRWVIGADGEFGLWRADRNGGQFKQQVGAARSLVRPSGTGANAVDYVHTTNGQTRTYPAVVERDGDTLKLFYALTGADGTGPPERAVEVGPHRNGVMYVFKKVDEKSK